jgi:hypothetical protein
LEQKLTGGSPESKTLQIKVAWSSISDWAPTLTAIWVEYELIGSPARRRKWRFAVSARDGLLQRDGSVDPRTGREIAADLWSVWEGGVTMTLRDVDYDITGRQFEARLAGISEEIQKPADGNRWGDSRLKLTVVEV